MVRFLVFLPQVADIYLDSYELLRDTSVERSSTTFLKRYVRPFPVETSCPSRLEFFLRLPKAIFHENSQWCTVQCAVLQMVPIQTGSTSDQERQRSDPFDRIRNCLGRRHLPET